jgi:hypothetical protein
METKLLKGLAAGSLPMTLNERERVEQVRTLVATGMVAAMLSPPGSQEPFARVLAITKEGHALLALSDLSSARHADKPASQ